MPGMRAPAAVSFENDLLGALNGSADVRADIERISLRYGEALPRVRDATFVYFPETAVCSIVTTMSEGCTVESATVGREGVVGAELALHGRAFPFETIAQIAGDAYRMRTVTFRRYLDHSPAFRAAVLHHIERLLLQALQSTACNLVHELLPRCCRWLLLCHDRAGRADLRLTHEMLAIMLGVRRPSVTETLGALAAQGLVARTRGQILIQDRQGLEASACECYGAVREHLAHGVGVRTGIS